MIEHRQQHAYCGSQCASINQTTGLFLIHTHITHNISIWHAGPLDQNNFVRQAHTQLSYAVGKIKTRAHEYQIEWKTGLALKLFVDDVRVHFCFVDGIEESNRIGSVLIYIFLLRINVNSMHHNII